MTEFISLFFTFLFIVNLIVLWLFIRTASDRLTKIIKVNTIDIIKEFNESSKETIHRNKKEIDNSAELFKNQIGHNKNELIKLDNYINRILEEIHAVSIILTSLEKTIENKVNLEKEIVKLKQILKRKGF